MSGALIMALVAVVLAISAIVLAFKQGGGDKGTVRRRITATMLGAAAIILGAFAYALHGWDAGA